MGGYAVPVTAGCVVLALFGGILIWVLHLARQSEAEKSEASATSAALRKAAQARAMAQAAVSTAPTDAALEQSLSEGRF